MQERSACLLRYLVRGVPTSRNSQSELQQELYDALPNACSVVVLAVVDGFSVDIEVTDYAPFSADSFEPYVSDHILPEAVRSRCNSAEADLQLLKARFL